MHVRALLAITLLLALALAPAAEAKPGRSASLLSLDAEEGGNATLRVVLNTTGGDGELVFDADDESFALTTVDGTANATFASLPAGSGLALAMRDASGWRLVGASCSAGTPENVTLVENGTTTCWFEAERLASLLVRVAAPGNGTFAFAGTGAGLPEDFTISVTNGTGSVSFADLLPGETYAVGLGENVGWVVVESDCDGLAPEAGEALECGFTLEARSRLRVTVNTRGADGTFAFAGEGDGVPASFELTTTNGTGSVSFLVDAGEDLTANLTLPAGWRLDAGACVDVQAPANGTVECVFDLTRLAQIRATIRALGDDGTFSLRFGEEDEDATTTRLTTEDGLAWKNFTDLDPDVDYELRLTAPRGWRVSSARCGEVHVAPGGVVSCGFTVTRLGEANGRVSLAGNGSGVEGVVVYADVDGDDERDAGERWDRTGATGRYTIEGIPLGDASLRLDLADEWRIVSPTSGEHDIVVTAASVANGKDFRIENATPEREGGRDDDGREAEGGRVGGGFGYWKNWRNHWTRAEVDAMVDEAADASSTLMPSGYAADASGLDQLLADAMHGCRRSHDHERCATLRDAAGALVDALNAQVAHPRGERAAQADDDQDADATEARGHGGKGKTKPHALRIEHASLREIIEILEGFEKQLDGKERKEWRFFLRG